MHDIKKVSLSDPLLITHLDYSYYPKMRIIETALNFVI